MITESEFTLFPFAEISVRFKDIVKNSTIEELMIYDCILSQRISKENDAYRDLWELLIQELEYRSNVGLQSYNHKEIDYMVLFNVRQNRNGYSYSDSLFCDILEIVEEDRTNDVNRIVDILFEKQYYSDLKYLLDKIRSYCDLLYMVNNTYFVSLGKLLDKLLENVSERYIMLSLSLSSNNQQHYKERLLKEGRYSDSHFLKLSSDVSSISMNYDLVDSLVNEIFSPEETFRSLNEGSRSELLTFYIYLKYKHLFNIFSVYDERIWQQYRDYINQRKK